MSVTVRQDSHKRTTHWRILGEPEKPNKVTHYQSEQVKGFCHLRGLVGLYVELYLAHNKSASFSCRSVLFKDFAESVQHEQLRITAPSCR